LSVRVKICGVNSPAAFDAAAEAGADWIGFVFYPPSPRYVTPGIAAGLSARLITFLIRLREHAGFRHAMAKDLEIEERFGN